MINFWRQMMTCAVKGCNKPRDGVGHHVVTKGAGGSDYIWNRINICRDHHIEIHCRGTDYFIEKHPETKKFIERAKEMERLCRLEKSNKLSLQSLNDREKELYEKMIFMKGLTTRK